MLKLFLALAILAGAVCYILLSAFAPTGKVIMIKGIVLASSSNGAVDGPSQFWFASTQGIFKVTYAAPPGCVSDIMPTSLGLGTTLTVNAFVTDTFQLSVCAATDGYIKSGAQTYPVQHPHAEPD